MAQANYQETVQAAATLQNSSVILNLILRRPGIRRKVDVDDIDIVEADKSFISVGKDIIQSPEYAAIRSHDGKIRVGLKVWSLPTAHLKAGLYRMPVTLAPKADEWIEKMLVERKDLIQTFLDNYENLKMDAEARLRQLFDIGEYPPIDKLKAAFVAEFSWEMHQTPSTLKSISLDIFEKEQKKAADKIAEDVEKITVGLRLQMLDLSERVADILRPGDDGRAKRFNSAATEKLQEFLKLIRDRNLTGDVELDKIAAKVGDIMNGLDPKVLKDNTEVKASALGTLTEAVETLRGLTETMPKRKFIVSGD